MKIIFFITIVLLFTNCKKVGKNHEINSKWKVEYYIENAITINIPVAAGDTYIQFNKKRFTCQIPVGQLAGYCEIYKDGTMDITGVDVSLLGGDSTKMYWEDFFVNKLLTTSSYYIKESSILNLNYPEGSMVLSKQ